MKLAAAKTFIKVTGPQAFLNFNRNGYWVSRISPGTTRKRTVSISLFELSQRYQEIKHKSETLLNMTDVFTCLSHVRRSARLEWIIIILIAIEIVLYVMEIMHK